MAKELSRYLTALDAAFLYFEKPTEAMHIGSCMVYEGRMERQELIELLEKRLHLTPRYRQRVVFPPFAANHPFWIDDPEFDISAHVEEVELEGPVTEEAFARVAAEAYQGPLPRKRPLWSATLIHGLPGDNTGIVWKVHHAMIDGVSGIDLTMVLNGFSPKDADPPEPSGPWSPEPLPDPFSLMHEAVRERVANYGRAFTDALFESFRPESVAKRLEMMREASGPTLPKVLRPAPRTRFNKRVSGQLGWAWRELSFTEVRQVKSVLGGTVNDLVLAVLSGGVGKYLREKGDDTSGLELRAMCPVSMRQADERGQLGNLVSVMIAPLHVGIEDPIERHQAGIEGMTRNKEARQAEAFYEMTQWSDLVPPVSQALAGRLPIPPTLFNTVSTNVPGPQIPLFQAGRRCLSWLPMGVVTSGIGLFTSILTYDKRITLGTTVDAKLIPDPWRLSECIRDAYEELRDLAGVKPVPFESFPLGASTHPYSSLAAASEVEPPSPAIGPASAEPPAAKKASRKATARKKSARRKATKAKTAKKKAVAKASKKVTKKKAAKKKAATSTRKKGSTRKKSSSRKKS
ncbi:MAG: wax ester/triacylglycerol synthase family O-acyltransferase [Acidobacteriota bacterium]